MNFFEFERAVLRLKEATRVQTDKDLAALLGMELSAFNKRKARGSFPIDRLEALARDRPELDIDVQHVLHGLSQRVQAMKLVATADAAIAELTRQARAANQWPPTFQPDLVIEGRDGPIAVLELKGGAELKLLRHYRSADPAGKRAIEATAEAVAKEFETTSMHVAEPTNIRQRFEAAVGQVARGDIMNKGTTFDLRSRQAKKK